MLLGGPCAGLALFWTSKYFSEEAGEREEGVRSSLLFSPAFIAPGFRGAASLRLCTRPDSLSRSLVFNSVSHGFLASGIFRLKKGKPGTLVDVLGNISNSKLVSVGTCGYKHQTDKTWKAQPSLNDLQRPPRCDV